MHAVWGEGRKEGHRSLNCDLEPTWEESGPGAGQPSSWGAGVPQTRGAHMGPELSLHMRREVPPAGGPTPNWASLCVGRGRTLHLSRTLQ